MDSGLTARRPSAERQQQYCSTWPFPFGSSLLSLSKDEALLQDRRELP